MSHGYQARVPKRILGDMDTIYDVGKFVKAMRNPSEQVIEALTLGASYYGYWHMLRYYVTYALKHNARLFSERTRDTIQANIVKNGNLRMLRWTVEAMLHLYDTAVAAAGEYGNMEILGWMQTGPEFWDTGDGDPTDKVPWLKGAAKYAHIYVIEWAIGKGLTPIEILEATIESVSADTLDWCRTKFAFPAKLVKYIERVAMSPRPNLFALAWLQKNFSLEYNSTLLTHIIHAIPERYELADELQSSDVRIKWDLCCIGPFLDLLRGMHGDGYRWFGDKMSNAIDKLMQFIRGCGIPGTCEAHPTPINIKEALQPTRSIDGETLSDLELEMGMEFAIDSTSNERYKNLDSDG